MNIFVTGATGVLGKPVVQLLIQAGHSVYALSRSEKNIAVVRELGAEPLTVDLFDSQALSNALKTRQIEAIVHLATKIPPTTQMGKVAAWQQNDHLRRDGTRVLVDAALNAGVRTLVYPSFYYVYPDRGNQWIDATNTSVQSHVIQQATIDAEAEVARFTQAGGHGVVLRLANLYGPAVPSAMEQWNLARKGFAVLPGAKGAYLSYVWLDDAARAIVTALTEAPAGVYDIADNEPLTRAAFATALARSVGRRRLLRIPNGLLTLVMGAAGDMTNRSQRVSNRRFQELTSWEPAVPDAYTGWALIAQAQRAEEREVQHV